MYKTHSIHNSVSHKVILVAVSILSNFVYADEQQSIYVSVLIQGQSNSEREIWKYQHEVPLAYRNKNDSSQVQYAYVSPTKKIGSNPFINPKYQYVTSSDIDQFFESSCGCEKSIYYGASY